MRGESRHWTLRKSIVGKRLPWEEPWPWGEPWLWEAKWIWDKGHSQPKPEKNWKNTYLHLTLLHPPPPNLLPRFLTGQTQSETRGKKDFWRSHYRTASGSRVGWEGVKSGSGGQMEDVSTTHLLLPFDISLFPSSIWKIHVLLPQYTSSPFSYVITGWNQFVMLPSDFKD